MPGAARVFSGTYAESRLYQVMAEALQKIAEIKIKYPPNLVGPDTEERKEAQQLVHVAENALKIFHGSILSKFDHGKAPGFFDLPGIGINAKHLYTLSNSIKTRETMLAHDVILLLPEYIAKANLLGPISNNAIIALLEKNKQALFKDAAKISGPNIEQLFDNIKAKIMALELGNQTDDPQHNKLALFITDHLLIDLWMPKDPMSYELMAFIADMIKRAPDKIFHLVPFIDPKIIPNLLQSGLIGVIVRIFGSFHLEYIDNTHSDSPSYAYNVTEAHETKIYNAEDYYAHRTFFLHNTLQPALRRYLAGVARTALLKRFINIEHQSLLNDFKSYQSTWVAPANVAERPLNIMDELNLQNQKLTLTQQFVTTLTMRLQQYNDMPLATLLQTKAQPLFDEYKANEPLDFESSFLNAPLPTELPGGTDYPNAVGGPSIQIKNRLNLSLFQQLESLKANEQHSIEQISQLTNRAVLEFEQQCHQIMDAILTNQSTLQERIECHLNANQQRQQLQQSISTLIQRARQFIPNYSRTNFSPVLEAVSGLLLKIEDHEAASNQQIASLSTQLEKAKLDIRFAETLQSADPREFAAIFDKNKHDLELLKTHQVTLREQKESIVLNNASKQAELQRLRLDSENLEVPQKSLQLLIAEATREIIRLNQTLQDTAKQIETDAKHEQRRIDKLTAIKTIITNDLHTKKIPFKAIDCAIEGISNPSKLTSGFDKLLSSFKDKDQKALSGFDLFIISLNQKLNIQEFNEYRKHQEKLFKSNPSPEAFNHMTQLLFTAIDAKIAIMTEAINKEMVLRKKISQIKQDIQTLDQQQQAELNQQADLSNQQQLLQLQIKELTEDLSHLNQEQIKISATIEQSTKQETELENTQYVLTALIEILSDINPLRHSIESIGDTTDETDHSQSLSEFKHVLAELVDKTNAIQKAINTSTESVHYLKTLSAIRDMLDTLEERITSIIKEKAIRSKARELAILTADIIPSLENPSSIDNVINEPLPRSPDMTKKRQALIREFISNINAYQSCQQNQLGLLNFVIANNREPQITFITTLLRELTQYADSGDTNCLLNLIRSNIKMSKNLELQSMLNKITADVLDFEDGLLDTENSETCELKDQQAEAVLNQLSSQNSTYVVLIRELKKQISDMQRDGVKLTQKTLPTGDALTRMAYQLKRNINHFIISHGATPPRKAVYQEFCEKFTARLHSEDNIMSKGKGLMKRIIANIEFILLWLIPKCLQLVTMPRFSFFSSKTPEDQHIVNLETIAHELHRSIH